MRISPHLARSAVRVPPEDRPPDRRSHPRYPIELDLRYRPLRYGWAARKEGFGKTRDLSTGSVFFRADQPLPKGLPVELSMDWPVRLDGVCALQLWITGKVVRSCGPETAVKIIHHEFRTCGMGPPLDQGAHART